MNKAKNPVIQGIYAITNNVNGRRYIGSSIDIYARYYRCHESELLNGTHWNKALQNAWNKYGAVSFTLAILEIVEDSNNLIEREQVYIDNEKKPYNICLKAGKPPSTKGMKLGPHNPEWNAKIGAAQLGKKRGPMPEDARKAMSESRRGKKLSPEHIANYVAARTGYTTEGIRRSVDAMIEARERDPESWKENIRQARLANGTSPKQLENLLKMAANNKGKKLPPEHVAKVAEANRKVGLTPAKAKAVEAAANATRGNPEFGRKISEARRRKKEAEL